MTEDRLQNLHSPIAYFIGGASDTAPRYAVDDFPRIEVVNPQSLHHAVECGVLHGLSRSIHEEIRSFRCSWRIAMWVTIPALIASRTAAHLRSRSADGFSGSLRGSDGGENVHRPLLPFVYGPLMEG